MKLSSTESTDWRIINLDERLQDLDRICRECLPSSDLHINIDKISHDVILEFIESIHTHKIFFFRCQEIFKYEVLRIPDQGEPPYFVGEVFINQKTENDVQKEINKATFNPGLPDKVWYINVTGIVWIEIICLNFSWDYKDL